MKTTLKALLSLLLPCLVTLDLHAAINFNRISVSQGSTCASAFPLQFIAGSNAVMSGTFTLAITDSAQMTVSATSYTLNNSAHSVDALFNLTGLTPGPATATIEEDFDLTVTTFNFTIVSCSGGSGVEVRLYGPATTAPARTWDYVVSVDNFGANDTTAPILVEVDGLPLQPEIVVNTLGDPRATPTTHGFTFNVPAGLVAGASADLLFELTPDFSAVGSTYPLGAHFTSGSSGVAASLPFNVVSSMDPNDKTGPQGVGAPHYLTGDSPLAYNIVFENDPNTATAPAQTVMVTDQLDPAKVDLSSFHFGPITFGSQLVIPPSGMNPFSVTVLYDVNNTPGDTMDDVEVQVDGSLDLSGLITWTFQTLDQFTHSPPPDPNIGFLPPDYTPPQGQGSVAFTVSPQPSLVTGTVISNRASIVFDLNPAIETPAWTNKVDKSVPVVTCRPNQFRPTSPTLCTAVVNLIGPISTSANVGTKSVTWALSGATSGSGAGNASGQIFNKGVTTVTYTITDMFDRTATCHFDVTVSDMTRPVFANCPANVTVQTGPGRTTCNQVAAWTPPTASDNCGVTSFTTDHNPGELFPVGNTTVTYTAKDAANNTQTCQFTVTVQDTTPPVIALVGPNPLAINAGSVFTDPGASASDNCGTSPISVSGTVDANTADTYTLTYSVNDPSGNAASTTRVVIVGAVVGIGEIVDATTIDPASPLVLDGGTLQNDSGGPVELENEVVLLADSTIAGDGKVTLSGPVVMEKDITLDIKTEVTITGEITDKEKALELTKIGAEELKLMTENKFDGGVTLKEGTLGLGDDKCLGTGTLACKGGDLEVLESEKRISNPVEFEGKTKISGEKLTFDETAKATGECKLDIWNETVFKKDFLEKEGAAGITKDGPGKCVMEGKCDCTLDTELKGGTLEVTKTGSILDCTIKVEWDVESAALKPVLKGEGEVNSVELDKGGTIEPGGSPGTLTLAGNLVWTGDTNPDPDPASYQWDINDAMGTEGAAVGWGFLDLQGAVNITATAAHPVTLKLVSLTLADVPGSMANFDPTTSYAWRILRAQGGITGFGPGVITIVTTGFANLTDGTFSLSLENSGHDLVLRYIARPTITCHPIVTLTGPASGSLYAINTSVNFTATFTDAAGVTHTGVWMFDNLSKPATIVEPSGSTPGSATATYSFTAAGVYRVKLTINDSCGGSSTGDKIDGMEVLVVVYDPSAGFVTGGGWIDSKPGAYRPNLSLNGRANFGFVSKYKKGANVPTGETEFEFNVANLSFHSSVYQWLVVSGAKAQYKGTGQINNAGSYGFLLTATDGQLTGGGGADKFRIKIWEINSGAIVYDNAIGASDDIDLANPQALGGGSIVIHK